MQDNLKKKGLEDRRRQSKQPWEQRQRKGSALWILTLLGALPITGAYVWGWLP